MAAVPSGNILPSPQTPTAHTMQHHPQAYANAAAAVAAANVHQQHATNQQSTPYVFINQVTANVNVHHGPVPNGSQPHSGGSKDTGNNGGLATGPTQQAHMQPIITIMPTPHP